MKRSIWLFISVLLFLVTLVVVLSFEDEAQIEIGSTGPVLPIVSVVEVSPATHRGVIQVHGEVQARWNSTMSSQVRGQIIKLSNSALVGAKVKKDELLIEIEATP